MRPVIENVFGTELTDPYRYMENLKDPAVVGWIRAQGAYTRAVLDSIPARAAFLSKVSQLSASYDVAYGYQRFGNREFFEERLPGSDNFDLMVRELGGPARKLVDLAQLRAAHGGTAYAINYYQASPDGTRIAVGVSAGGSEDASLIVYDTATGAALTRSIDRARQAGPTWSDDSKTLYFSLLQPVPADAPTTDTLLNISEYSWDLKGEPQPIFGHAAPTAPSIPASHIPGMATWPGARVAAIEVVDGVHPEIDAWLTPMTPAGTSLASPPWTPLVVHDDGVTAIDAVGDHLVLLSHKNAPTFQVLALEAGQPLSAARVLLPARPDRVIDRVSAATDGVYVTTREGVYSHLLRVPLAGGTPQEIALPFKGSISELFTDERRAGAVVVQTGWTHPPVALAVDEHGRVTSIPLGHAPAGFDPAAYETLDLKAVAADGVQVPLSYTRRKGAQGPQIVLLNAYGSYGISSSPSFSVRAFAFIDAGRAADATCHVRGGGELGEAWRLGGKDANKPNTWRDLIACGETLIAKGYTTRDRLFIAGGSAGGITMGMALTERPDLFAGVIDMVPDANATRMEFQAAGPANIPEFGSISDPQQFRNLLAMDSYQHVRDGAAYPPVLLNIGLNDSRVEPWQAAKLTARLQASGSKSPVLLRVDEDAGHGFLSTKTQADQTFADVSAFIFWIARLPGWMPARQPVTQ